MRIRGMQYDRRYRHRRGFENDRGRLGSVRAVYNAFVDQAGNWCESVVKYGV